MRADRSSRERGVALVEFAIVLPLIALFLFGIVEFGLAFSDSISVRTGTRDAARAAVVLETGPGGCSLASTTPTAGDDTAALMCLAKDRIGLDDSQTRVKVVFPNGAPALAGDPIRVCTMYPITSHTGLFTPILSNRRIRAKVEMRMEKDAPAGLIESAEAPLSGADWSFCTS